MSYISGDDDVTPRTKFIIHRAALLLTVLLGALTGLGMYTFQYAEGLSYLSTDPRACANCHIMEPQFDSWQKSGHQHVAVCADCHMPHTFFAKWIAKAENGWHHSVAFTFQNFHEPIVIKEKNARILQESCLHCHGDFVHEIALGTQPLDTSTSCVHCHRTVGHGPRAGLGGPETASERNWSLP